MTAHRPSLITLVILLPLALSACAPAAPPAEPAQVLPEPTPTEQPEAAPAPTSVFDIACADLAVDAEVAAVFPTPVQRLGRPAVDVDSEDQRLWEGIAVQQLGGLACAWGDGERIDAGGRALEILALPAAVEGWEQYVGTYGDGADFENCRTSRYCSIESLVGDTWLSTVVTNPGDATAATALHDAAEARIAEAARVDSGWAPPADGLPAPGTCEDVATPEQVAAAIAWPDELIGVRPGGGWSVMATTWQMLGIEPCSYGVPYADASGAFVDWIPGGEWAWADATARGVPLTLEDAVDRDAASLTCTPTDCWVDVLAAGSWFRMSIHPDGLVDVAYAAEIPFEYAPSMPIEDSATAIAEAIIGNVRSP